MKKILAIVLVLALLFTVTACGKGNTEIITTTDYDGEYVDCSTLEEVEDDMGVFYNFTVKVRTDYEMKGTVDKMDYSKPHKFTDIMEKAMKEACAKVFPGTFDIYSNYEEDDDVEAEVDKFAYTTGTDKEDGTGIILESGVYHSIEEDAYYHYTNYMSNSCYEITDTPDEVFETIAREFAVGYGVEVSVEELKDAAMLALSKAEEIKDMFAVYKQVKVETDEYTEIISIEIDGLAYEGEDEFFYAYVDRAIVYK